MIELMEHGNVRAEFSLWLLYLTIFALIGLSILGHWLWSRYQVDEA